MRRLKTCAFFYITSPRIASDYFFDADPVTTYGFVK